ncbi:hypothetical protein [Mycobacterium mantenii]|nr:hypothetical protein [Mycobacterium mantenii]
MPITDKAHLRPYPCTERYGLIWVSLSEPAAPITDVAWDGDRRYRRIHAGVSEWRSNPIQIVENLLADPDLPFTDVTADVPFCVRSTLTSADGAQHHRLLSLAPIDNRSTLVASVIWTSSADGDDAKATGTAMADLAQLKSKTETGGVALPIVETSEEDTIVADWRRRLVAAL